MTTPLCHWQLRGMAQQVWRNPARLARPHGGFKMLAPKALYNEQAIDYLLNNLLQMADTDETLKKLGIHRKELRALESDDEIYAAIETRREALIATPWRLESGLVRQNNFLWREIERVITATLRGAFNAVLYGYSVQKVIYLKLPDGKIGLKEVSEKPFEWFEPKSNGDLIYRSMLDPVMEDNTGLEVDRSERDAKLVSAGIWKLTPDYLLRVYDYEDGDFEIPPAVLPNSNPPIGGTKSTNFAASNQPIKFTSERDVFLGTIVPKTSSKFTPNQQEIETLADGVLANLKSPIPEGSIFNAIKAASDYEDLANRLAVLFDETDTAEFRQVLERATFAADCIGVAHAR
jgi:hypothetical protein